MRAIFFTMLPKVVAMQSSIPSTQIRLRMSMPRSSAAHADRVHRMVVHAFTEFLNMMVIEKAHNATGKHGGEYVRW